MKQLFSKTGKNESTKIKNIYQEPKIKILKRDEMKKILGGPGSNEGNLDYGLLWNK